MFTVLRAGISCREADKDYDRDYEDAQISQAGIRSRDPGRDSDQDHYHWKRLGLGRPTRLLGRKPC